MTPTPSPEAEALPTLPVVEHQYQWNDNPGRWFPVGRLDNLPGLMTSHMITVRTLTPLAPAEAAIVALRAEVAELRKERDALRAAKRIDVEAVMLLAEGYAKASSELDESIRSRSRAPRMVNRHDLRVRVAFKAAREALRATLLGDGGTL